MAETIKYISFKNLQDYDSLLKPYVQGKIDEAEATSLHTGAIVGDTIALFKETTVPTTGEGAVDLSKAAFKFDISSSEVDAIKDVLDGYTAKGSVKSAIEAAAKEGTDAQDQVKTLDESLADVAKSGSGADVSVSSTKITATNVTSALEEIADSVSTLDGNLADVAKSGDAADVAIADAAGKFDATNVEGALLEVKNIADANKTAIDDLDIAGDIEKAIEDLDYTDTAVTNQFVTAVSEEDGIISVSRAALTADDIPTLTLDKISDAGTAAASDVATTAIAEESTDTSLVTAAQVAKFVKDEVADLSGATHFRGVFAKLDDVEDPKSGDIAIVDVKEYIYDGTNWKELGDESIYVTKTTTIAGVDLENDITKEEMLTALNIEDGAQVNVLEGVQVNGTDLTVDGDKKVNVTVASGSANGTIAVNGSDVAVKGLGSAAYEDTTAFESAGAITTAIEELDATVSTVTEANPTPVVAVTITEEDGILTGVTASIKDNTFATYAQGEKADSALQPSDLVVATDKEIADLFADEEVTE